MDQFMLELQGSLGILKNPEVLTYLLKGLAFTLGISLIAIAVSLLFNYLPMLSGISGGFVVIICAVIAAAVGAVLFPVAEEAPQKEDCA